MTERLIQELTEISGLTTIDYEQSTRKSTILLCDKAIEITNTQNLRLFWLRTLSGRYEWPTSRSLEKQNWHGIWKMSLSQRFESNRWRADGVRVETYSQDSLHWEFSKRFKGWWLNYTVNLSSSKVGSSSCQCTTSLYGWERGNTDKYILNFVTVANYARRFLLGRWSFFCIWIKEGMIRNLFCQTRWRLTQNCWKNDTQFCRKRSSSIWCHQLPWKEENSETKKRVRSLFASTIVQKVIELILRTIISVI